MVKLLRTHLIELNTKTELMSPKRNTFATLPAVIKSTQIRGNFATAFVFSNTFSSLRKHKKTVHGPDSHVLGGKKPRQSTKDDDNYGSSRIKSSLTVLKSEKTTSGEFYQTEIESKDFRSDSAYFARWKYQLRTGFDFS